MPIKSWSVCAGGEHYTLVYDDGRIVNTTLTELMAAGDSIPEHVKTVGDSKSRTEIHAKLDAETVTGGVLGPR